MKKTLIYIIMIILWALTMSANVKQVVNPDNPTKGTWDLKPVEVWEITEAGDTTLSYPSFTVSRDGTLCVWDWKNKESYLFDSKGTFKKTFGKRGEGPGEMRYHLNSYFIGDRLITADANRLHYFTKDGVFVKSAPHLYWQYEPRFFIDENRFIAAPSGNLPGGKGLITLCDLENNKKKVVDEFTIKDAKRGRGPGLSLIGLSPSLVMDVDRASGTFYHGTGNRFEIHASNPEGLIFLTFSVKRDRRKISFQTRVKEIKIMDPSAPAKELAKHLPDELVYFHKIQAMDGLVYVFEGNFGINWPNQPIDIFSKDGKYLYRATFTPPEGTHIYFSSHCIQIVKEFLYVVLEDEEGDVKIAKYKILLPR
jgi:hypothetical protein